ncbi:hypothetical protein CN975_25305, partial [Bacillus cereus]
QSWARGAVTVMRQSIVSTIGGDRPRRAPRGKRRCAGADRLAECAKRGKWRPTRNQIRRDSKFL